jgi:hypothetical protein
MSYEWSSWSGNIRFTPARIEEPENEEQVILTKESEYESFVEKLEWLKLSNLA